jgi:hypothetical protein
VDLGKRDLERLHRWPKLIAMPNYTTLPLTKIVPDPNNNRPKLNLDYEADKRLFASLQSLGQLQNGVARELPSGLVQLLAGHRRFEGLVELNKLYKPRFATMDLLVFGIAEKIDPSAVRFAENNARKRMSAWQSIQNVIWACDNCTAPEKDITSTVATECGLSEVVVNSYRKIHRSLPVKVRDFAKENPAIAQMFTTVHWEAIVKSSRPFRTMRAILDDQAQKRAGQPSDEDQTEHLYTNDELDAACKAEGRSSDGKTDSGSSDAATKSDKQQVQSDSAARTERTASRPARSPFAPLVLPGASVQFSRAKTASQKSIEMSCNVRIDRRKWDQFKKLAGATDTKNEDAAVWQYLISAMSNHVSDSGVNSALENGSNSTVNHSGNSK